MRTALTFISITIAFLLFGLLFGVASVLSHLASDQRLGRVFVESSFGRPLPISYLGSLERLPGIRIVTAVAFCGGSYQDPKNSMLVIATDPARWLTIRPEYTLPAELLARMTQVRMGALITETLARHYGWKVGDRIALTSNVTRKDGTTSWPFEIVGVIVNRTFNSDNPLLLVNFNYFDDSRASDIGTVNRFLLRVNDPVRTTQVARQIDALFENSSSPTRSQSEEEVAQSQIAALGDVRFFTRAIIGAAFVTLLLLTGNTMMESVRERTREFGVLMTLGFPSSTVVWLMVTESLMLFLTGTLVGLLLAAVAFPIAKDYVGTARLPASVVILGLIFGTVLAIGCIIIPAWRTARLRIVDALGAQ